MLTPNSPGVFQLCLWPLMAPGYLGGGLPCLSSALRCQYPKLPNDIAYWPRHICNQHASIKVTYHRSQTDWIMQQDANKPSVDKRYLRQLHPDQWRRNYHQRHLSSTTNHNLFCLFTIITGQQFRSAGNSVCRNLLCAQLQSTSTWSLNLLSGFNLNHSAWSTLNRFRTGQGRCAANPCR